MTAPSRQFMIGLAANNVFEAFAGGDKYYALRHMKAFVYLAEKDGTFGKSFVEKIRAEFARISSQYEERAA